MTTVVSPRRMATAEILAVALGVAAFCCLFFHGFEVFQYNLSIDEELMLHKVDLFNYIGRGRWGAIVVSWLRTPLPVTHAVGGLVLYSVAFFLLVRRLEIQHVESIIIGSCFFFGFPVLLYAFAFSNLILVIGLGTLISVLLLYIVDVQSFSRVFFASVIVAFVTAIYQSLFFFIVVIFLADLLRAWLQPKDVTWPVLGRRAGWYAVILLSGLFMYGLISFILLKIFNQQLTYLPSYLAPAKLASNPYSILKTSAKEALELYTGSSAVFVGFKRIYRIFAILCACILLGTLIQEFRKGVWPAFLLGGLLIAISVTPFIQHPMNGGHMPYRTLIALPAAVAILALFAAETASQAVRRWVLLPVIALVFFEFSAINNKQYFAGYWALERDKVLGAQIISRIEEMFPRESTYTIAVVGRGPVKHDALIPKVPSSTLGTSFFRWDGGNDGRIAAFLNFLSSAKFTIANPDQTEEAFETATTMPSWPDRGSIVRMDGVVLIKLSDATDQQVGRFCKRRTSEFCEKHRH